MHAAIVPITTVTLDTILYGDPDINVSDNKKVFDAVHAFIKTTERFLN